MITSNDDSKQKVETSPPSGGAGGGSYGNIHEGASHLVFELAKELRRNMTDAERKLWEHLKKYVSGHKFRRQHPLKNYIADFYCHKLKLIIEADGGIHKKKEVKEYDETRQKDLESWGYTVIRFANEEIFNEEEKVMRMIDAVIQKLEATR
jgi:very-short-patch-repair endonuclease